MRTLIVMGLALAGGLLVVHFIAVTFGQLAGRI